MYVRAMALFYAPNLSSKTLRLKFFTKCFILEQLPAPFRSTNRVLHSMPRHTTIIDLIYFHHLMNSICAKRGKRENLFVRWQTDNFLCKLAVISLILLFPQNWSPSVLSFYYAFEHPMVEHIFCSIHDKIERDGERERKKHTRKRQHFIYSLGSAFNRYQNYLSVLLISLFHLWGLFLSAFAFYFVEMYRTIHRQKIFQFLNANVSTYVSNSLVYAKNSNP